MDELRQIYRKRKQQILPLALGFATFFVFFRVVMPQWTDIVDAQQLITTKSSTIAAKESSLSLLRSVSDEKVNSDFTLATTALPLKKDIVLIYNQLNSVATRSNVELGGFSVKIGGIYETETPRPGRATVGGVPSINILVSVSGENDSIRLFASELYKSIPLVQINSIDVGSNDARYDVNFYYKPIVALPKNVDTTSLVPLNAAEESQLEELRLWQ